MMKWLLLTCFLLWARHGEGGALKCLPGDDECLSQLSEVLERQEIDIRRPTGSSDAPSECLPGSEWESHCHRCRCLDGEAQCLRQPECDSIGEPIRCAPNTTFERECNTCVCLESGLGLCTVEPCERIPTEAPVPSKPNIPKGVDCAPGTTWQSQCNDCVCSPDGHRYCTERACAGQESEPLLRCAPQSQWKNDCNMCWCNSGRAMCTKMGCAGIPSDMHFDDEESKPNREELPEPNELPEVLDLNSNDLLESDSKDQIHVSEYLEDLDTTTDQVDDDLIGVNLKDFEDYDHNDVDTSIQIPDQVRLDFAVNIESKARNEDVELLEDLLKTDDNKQIAEESALSQNSDSVDKDVEVVDASYSNYNSQGQQVNLHRVKKRSACKPNQEFQNDCNTCKCSANGELTCTQNECMDRDKEEVDKEVEVFAESEGADHVERHSVCKPSATFYVGCNPCHCNSDGTDYKCTNKPCPLPEDVEVFHELNILKSAKNTTRKVCVENRMFIKDCNTCWCNEDGTSYFCTRKVCIQDTEPVVEGPEQKLRIIKRECRPDEVFEVDCNMCRCNADGKSFSCTRRACVDQDSKNQTVSRKTRATPQEAPKTCQPGQEFRLDCNKCLCDNEGQDFSCTRMDCAALNNNNNGARRKRDVSQKHSCVPGTVFKQDCNMCFCYETGVMCTGKLCLPPNYNNGARRKRDVMPPQTSRSCPRGNVFQHDCNTCLCHEGHTKCTRVMCHNYRKKRDVSQKVPVECVPGSVFDQGCNVCRCTEDGGHAMCTLKRCARSNDNSTLTATESSFRCNPGEQFKRSCNDCSCSADGRSVFCTLRVCDDELTP